MPSRLWERAGVCRRRSNFQVRVSSRAIVLVLTDDDHELLCSSSAPRHGAASPRDAATPARNASFGGAFQFTTPA